MSHTVLSYMIGRGSLGPSTPSSEEVRKFFETRAANWDSMGETANGDPEKTKGWGNPSRWPTEVVVTAVALAKNDADTTGHLQPLTRRALDQMWKLQRADGGFNWIAAPYPPLEGSLYYAAALAAVGVGTAPEGYAETPQAKAGMEKLSAYLKQNSGTAVLHDRAVVLWASMKLPHLLAADERQAIDSFRVDQCWAPIESDIDLLYGHNSLWSHRHSSDKRARNGPPTVILAFYSSCRNTSVVVEVPQFWLGSWLNLRNGNGVYSALEAGFQARPNGDVLTGTANP